MDRKQILSAMEPDVEKSLHAFNTAVADLMNATYIIVSGKISRLLQTIAASRPLYDYLVRETNGYNFVEEFRNRQFRDEQNRAYLEVPQEQTEMIRFAFCMLFAVDTGKLNIEQLLHTFYYNSDANTELRSFCDEIVKPFAENLNSVFGMNTAFMPVSHASPIATAAPKPVMTPSPATAKEETAPIVAATPDDSLLASMSDVVSGILSIAAKSNDISSLHREEMMLVCDAFITAASLKDAKSIRVMYIALKNTVKHSEIYDELHERYNALGYLIQGLGIPVEE